MAQTSLPGPIRANVLELISRSEAAKPGDRLTDAEYFLEQLRAVVGTSSPTTRLRDHYGAGRTDRLCRIYAIHSD